MEFGMILPNYYLMLMKNFNIGLDPSDVGT